MPDLWPIIGATFIVIYPSSVIPWWCHSGSWWQPDLETSISPCFQAILPFPPHVQVDSMWNHPDNVHFLYSGQHHWHANGQSPTIIHHWNKLFQWIFWWIFWCIHHWNAVRWKDCTASTIVVLGPKPTMARRGISFLYVPSVLQCPWDLQKIQGAPFYGMSCSLCKAQHVHWQLMERK